MESALVVLGGFDALDEDGDQFVAFLKDRFESFRRAKRFSFDDLEPDVSLAEFLERDFHLVDEVFSRFGALCLAVVWSRRGAAPNQLVGDVSSCFGIW